MHRILVKRRVVIQLLGKPTRRWDDIIKMCHQEIEFEVGGSGSRPCPLAYFRISGIEICILLPQC
jgi:hypothetical protein